MKRLLPILVIGVLAFSSCSSTYYYSILDTKDDFVDKVDNGDFLFENDSLWIAYCFKGESAPIQITVFNKTDKPIYVDWSRSVFIINDLAVSYAGQNVGFSGSSEGVAYPHGGYYNGGFEGNFKISENISFIPPKTMATRKTLNIEVGFENLHKRNYKTQIMASKKEETFKIQRAHFTEENTPLSFRSYLTIYSEPDKPMSFEQQFYISDLIKTAQIKPNNLPGDLAERGDWFYVEKPANNSFVNILLGTTIVAGTVILDATLDSEEY